MTGFTFGETTNGSSMRPEIKIENDYWVPKEK
jgi:hypothetical protein